MSHSVVPPTRFEIWRVRAAIWLLFPLLGLHSYLLKIDLRVVAYVLHFFPYILLLGPAFLFRGKAARTPRLGAHVRKLKWFLVVLAFGALRSVSLPYSSIPRFFYIVLTFLLLLTLGSQYVGMLWRTGRSARLFWEDIHHSVLSLVVLNLVAVFVFRIDGPNSVDLGSFVSRISPFEFWVAFPFVRNPRDFAQAAGGLCLVGIFLYRRERGSGRSIVYLCTAAVGLASVIITDARMVLLQVLVMSLVLVALIRMPVKYVRVSGMVLAAWQITYPMIHFALLRLIGSALVDLNNVLAISGRVFIWAAGAFGILRFRLTEWIFGLGMYSHRSSQTNDLYTVIFGAWSNPEGITLHNQIIQLIMDVGLVGFLAYLLVFHGFFEVLRSVGDVDVSEGNRRAAILLLVLALYFSGIGITESITPYYYSTFQYFLILMVYTGALIRQRSDLGGGGPIGGF